MDFIIKGLLAFLILPLSDNPIWTDSMTDQEKCQAEADYMAEKHICGHVWGVIGRFEGIGYGFRPDCNTCTPGNSGMVCTGDASAMGANGMWYRVRSWR